MEEIPTCELCGDALADAPWTIRHRDCPDAHVTLCDTCIEIDLATLGLRKTAPLPRPTAAL